MIRKISHKLCHNLLLSLLIVWVAGAARAEVTVQEVSAGGLTAWLVEDHHIPALTVRMVFRDAGTASDVAPFHGRAGLFADMLTKGAGTRDEQAFTKALESKAIRLSTDASRDSLSVHMQTLTDHQEAAFSLLGDMLQRPRFDAGRLEEARARALSRLRQAQESPYYRGQLKWNRLAYGDHPYANPPLGTQAGIEALRTEELRRFHRHYVTRENAVMAVVGAIDAETLADLMAASLAGLPADFKPDRAVEHTTVAAAGTHETIAMDIPQRVVLFGGAGITREDEDFYAAYVMNHIIGGMTLTSRLGEAVRKEQGLSYHIGTNLDTSLHAAAFTGSFATKAAEAARALKTTKETLHAFAVNGTTAAELAQAKGFITGSFPLAIDNNNSIAHYLIGMQLYDLGKAYLNRRNDYFEAVTLEAVNRVAKRLIHPEKLIIVQAGQVNPPQPEPSE